MGQTADGFREPYARTKGAANRERRTVLRGSKVVSNSFGAPPTRNLFIYRVKKHVPLEEVREYIEKEIPVINLVKVSHENATFQSFKLTINAADLDTVFTNGFWPVDVGCARYIMRRRQATTNG
jgi:hypothetical protein